MSVINSMLRDLDRRHAPMPLPVNAQATALVTRRAWPRLAFALCVLLIAAALSWKNHILEKIVVPAHGRSAPALATTRREYIPIGSVSASMPTPVAASTEAERPTSVPHTKINNDEIKTQTVETQKPTPLLNDTGVQSPLSAGEGKGEGESREKEKMVLAPSPLGEEKSKTVDVQRQSIESAAAPVIKQERKNPDALNDERYQLARAALSQGQPQRAYELLRNDPPPVSTAVDYHAVLAALEQQLGHYSDASARYQQLLSLDQNQASWWLGLGLSFDGEHRNVEALAAYRQAAALNTLPEAAQQYIAGRIAALGK